MDSGPNTASLLRTMVRKFPGIRPDLEFWDDEYNSIPNWKGSDEAVQAKYLPRALLYNWANGVRTFIWQLISGTDGNELDYFGLLHGMAYRSDDFEPLLAFAPVQHTNALFADTRLDPSIHVSVVSPAKLPANMPFKAYGFRRNGGKAIVAYWLAVHSNSGGGFPAHVVDLRLINAGIERPVLIDIYSGSITSLVGYDRQTVLVGLPLRDSVMAIADETFFDWPVLPEVPSSLRATVSDGVVSLHWQVHGTGMKGVVVERRIGDRGAWETVGRIEPAAADWLDRTKTSRSTCYRVRAFNDAGTSAYSNIVRLNP